MYRSRLNKYEERKEKRQIFGAIIGSIALFAFLALFGVKILVGFSLLVDKLRGAPPKQEQEQTYLLPPTIFPIEEATNSASFAVSGRSSQKGTVLLFVNDEEARKISVSDDGTFSVSTIRLKEGVNTISAKLTDDTGKTTELSEVQKIIYKKTKPTLEITDPSDKKEIRGDTNTISIKGKTEDTAHVTINDRFVVVNSDGTFSYTFSLSDGENKIKTKVTDIAGNTTEDERTVTYKK